MISGIKRAAIYDPATGTTVQFDKVSPEGEFKICEPIEVESGKGGTIYAGDDSSVTLKTYDVSNYSQLQTWMDNETPVRMVIEGIEEHILWYESVPLIVRKNYEGSVGKLNSLSITLSKKGGMHNIYALKNLLLGGIGAAWPTDDDNDGKVDNVTFATASGTDPTYSIASPRYQIISSNGDATITGKIEFEFPIQGSLLVAAVELAINMNTFNSHTLTVKDFSGGSLTSDTDTSDSNTLNLTTPANTYKISYEFVNLTMSSTTTDETDVNVPYVGTDANDYSNINY